MKLSRTQAVAGVVVASMAVPTAAHAVIPVQLKPYVPGLQSLILKSTAASAKKELTRTSAKKLGAKTTLSVPVQIIVPGKLTFKMTSKVPIPKKKKTSTRATKTITVGSFTKTYKTAGTYKAAIKFTAAGRKLFRVNGASKKKTKTPLVVRSTFVPEGGSSRTKSFSYNLKAR